MKKRSLPSLTILAFGLAIASSGLAQRGRFNLRAPILPDPAITPGASLDVTREDVCTPGYSKKVRNVPQSVKAQAYKNYGITHREKGEYEVDHLVSLEIGGSNSIRNLWPESFKTRPWNAHVKDELENELHARVCSGSLDLKTAQQDIAKDWIAAYRKYFHTTMPRSKRRKRETAGGGHSVAPPGSGDHSVIPEGDGNLPAAPADRNQVWVIPGTFVYWRPGSTNYGKGKKGKYMREEDALKAGYRAAEVMK